MLGAACALIAVPALGGQAAGTVNAVNINGERNGAFVQLNIPVSFRYEPACPNANWAFIPATDSQYASIVASLLAAKMSGEVVTVYTVGCVSTAIDVQPRISSVDVGTRMSGT
jgi:hypothetical protein